MTDIGAVILIVIGFIVLKLCVEAIGNQIWP